MTECDRTRWAEKDFAKRYLETANIRIVERRRLLAIVKSFYHHFLAGKQQCRVLDLGCGAGILIHELLSIDGSISATLVDGSIRSYKEEPHYSKLDTLTDQLEALNDV